jgi:peroxiredoxin
MVELGELEKHYEEFAKKNVRIVVASNDDQSAASMTQTKFPDLIVISDAQQNIAKAMQVIQPGKGPGGTDTNAPTTFLVDGTGYVRWLFRPNSFFVRLSPNKLLAAVNETWQAQ